MSDYISREAALTELQNPELFNVSPKFLQILRDLPAADVEPVRHGRWMHEETEGGFHIWSCSRCGRGMNGNPKGTNLYCYHCGSKMDLEDNDDNRPSN